MASRSVKMEWPDSIVAERHEITGRWVLSYLDDNQAMACHEALKKPTKQTRKPDPFDDFCYQCDQGE